MEQVRLQASDQEMSLSKYNELERPAEIKPNNENTNYNKSVIL